MVQPLVVDEAFIRSIERPHPNLMKLYFLQALCATVAFPFVIVPLYFRYHTLRYRFDAGGISAQWGILFHREVYLTYKRIQDIHVPAAGLFLPGAHVHASGASRRG